MILLKPGIVLIVVINLHEMGYRILHRFLPDFQVGGRNRHNPESEIPDDRIYHISLNAPFFQRWFTFTGGRRGSLTATLDLYEFCVIC